MIRENSYVNGIRLLPCSCGDSEHHLIYCLDPDDPQVWFHYQLMRKVWYKRVWIGIKYIFGFQSRYGMYGEMLIDENNINHIEAILNHVKYEKPSTDITSID